MNYAIVDIETTGGYASGNSIIEIAIITISNNHITDTFHSLIHTEQAIPAHITTLTGIDKTHIESAPTFEELASKIHDLLQGKIFVAHNVNFDYSFLKHHLALHGYSLNNNKLCTVRLSRKIFPGLNSYSLGNLCNSLHIPIENRHRAIGDANATAILFLKILEKDTNHVIQSMLKRNSREQQLPPNLPKEQFLNLPTCIGVYYFHNAQGKVIYVGKAKNIQKRINQHFTGSLSSAQRQGFFKEIHSISYEICGTELIALILEVLEIQRLYPKFNRALKKYEPKYGLFAYEDLSGYKRLILAKYSKSMAPIHTFNTQYEGIQQLKQLIQKFNLHPSLCKYNSLAETISLNEPLMTTTKDYNDQVNNAIEYLKSDAARFYIIDKGRHEDESSCLWIENGVFYGMGYFDNTCQMFDSTEIKLLLTPYQGNQYILQLIMNYVSKYPEKVKNMLKSYNASHEFHV